MPRLKPLWESDPIQFLIFRKFPLLETLSDEERRNGNVELEQTYQELLTEEKRYLTELASLNGDDLSSLMAVEKEAFLNEYLARVEMFDNNRFFSEPYSNADLDHWSKISFWTCDEAVALSLGKDPRLVTWENIEEFAHQSGFVYVFAQRRELVRRAVEAGQLMEKNTPSYFLAWAMRTRFYMPDQIVRAVIALGEQVADWKTEHDKLLEFLEEHTEQTEDTKATLQRDRQEAVEAAVSLYSDLNQLAQDHELLKLEAEELRAYKMSIEAESAKASKPLATLERTTMLKLVMGMAVGFYGYDPAKSRNPTIPEIKSDLALKGVKIDEGTIRKYLDEAKALWPFE